MAIRLPGKIQQGAFGTRDVAPAGATPVQGRVPRPRPQLLQRGPAQGREHFTTKDGKLDEQAIVRALNQLQSNTDEASSQARANPMANGHLFQGIALKGPLIAGPVGGGLPSVTNLWPGFMFYDTSSKKPFYNDGAGSWRDAASTIITGTSAGPQTYTVIEHGFGSPAVGALITNLSGGTIEGPAQIITTGTSTDNVQAQLLVPIYGAPVADIYLFY